MLTDPWQGRDPLACAGVDEVGRGSLFGPVFAGVVVLGQPCLAPLAAVGLTDSKKLTARRRADLVPTIQNLADAWALGQASAAEIDRHGIRVATEWAMLRAVQKLPRPPQLLLVDGEDTAGRVPIFVWSACEVKMKFWNDPAGSEITPFFYTTSV